MGGQDGNGLLGFPGGSEAGKKQAGIAGLPLGLAAIRAPSVVLRSTISTSARLCDAYSDLLQKYLPMLLWP